MTSVDQDIQLKLDLPSNEKDILYNNIQKILDLTDQFNIERQNCKKFRIQGQIECLSSLIGIKKTSNTISDIFNVKTVDDVVSDFYSFKDFFDIVILYPDTFFKRDDGFYNLLLKPLSIGNIDLFNSGFYTNLFYDQIHQFILENDIDITNLVTKSNDNRFFLPVNHLFVYFRFKNTETKFVHDYISIEPNSGTTKTIIGNITDNEILNNGVFGGIYNLDFSTNFRFDLITENNSLINFVLNDRTLVYTYNTLNSIILQDFSSNIETGNILTTDNIPFYAYLQDDITNNFNAQTNEYYSIDYTPIFSGTTRLTISDPMLMQPRKLIFNINSGFYEYYLDNNINDTTYFNLYLNNNILDNGNDYILSDFDKTKVILRFKPQPNDLISTSYLKGENYIWRDLLDIGFTEPDTGIGTNYPFINGFNYIFSNMKLSIKPDLTDPTTNSQYCKFVFSTSASTFTNSTVITKNC